MALTPQPSPGPGQPPSRCLYGCDSCRDLVASPCHSVSGFSHAARCPQGPPTPWRPSGCPSSAGRRDAAALPTHCPWAPRGSPPGHCGVLCTQSLWLCTGRRDTRPCGAFEGRPPRPQQLLRDRQTPAHRRVRPRGLHVAAEQWCPVPSSPWHPPPTGCSRRRSPPPAPQLLSVTRDTRPFPRQGLLPRCHHRSGHLRWAGGHPSSRACVPCLPAHGHVPQSLAPLGGDRVQTPGPGPGLLSASRAVQDTCF